MVTGRKPVPAETRRQRGEQARPLPVVVGGRKAPRMPSGLTPRMKTCWRFLITTAGDSIDLADAGIYEAAAVAWGRAQDARAALAREKNRLTEATPQGRVENRLLAIERAAWKEFRALAESLPLSPWGRARLGLKNAAPTNQITADIGLPPRLLHAVGDD